MNIYLRRLENLRRLLDKVKCDAFLINHPANLSYYTGYSGDSAYLLLSPDRSCFFTDGRYTTQAASEIPESVELIEITSFNSLCQHLNTFHDINRVGVDERKLSAESWLKLSQLLKGGEPLVAVAETLCQPRRYKDENEIYLLRRAVAIAEEALQKSLSLLRPGTSERDLAAEIEYQIRRAGGEKAAFPLIVASGPRSAMPHGVASDRFINPGDLVTIDFGACYQGYHSDQTCTFFLEEPGPESKKVYEALYQAQRNGFNAVKNGITTRELDRLVRDVLTESGLGHSFSHGTGHGIGLEIHEAPSISPHGPDEILQPGMVFTIEPGCYFPGRWGIRIEDMVYLTPQGAEKLTTIDKSLAKMIIA
ncbi:MAG: aminopeptidase P family protein [Deltaproteobacteria bacterium]|nr:aminopeptidase P family protein [Deltaproteobacteria bacterium]